MHSTLTTYRRLPVPWEPTPASHKSPKPWEPTPVPIRSSTPSHLAPPRRPRHIVHHRNPSQHAPEAVGTDASIFARPRHRGNRSRHPTSSRYRGNRRVYPPAPRNTTATPPQDAREAIQAIETRRSMPQRPWEPTRAFLLAPRTVGIKPRTAPQPPNLRHASNPPRYPLGDLRHTSKGPPPAPYTLSPFFPLFFAILYDFFDPHTAPNRPDAADDDPDAPRAPDQPQ
jgi:hypothetical protein